MNQSIIDEVVRIATRAALNGTPVENITWVPSTSASQSSIGSFVVKYAEQMTGSQRRPWD